MTKQQKGRAKRAPKSGMYATKRGQPAAAAAGEVLPPEVLGIDPLEGYSEHDIEALAEEGYQQRDNVEAWEDVEPPEVDPDVRSVVSVRFSRGELGSIERAAKLAGIPISTYIRNVAMAASSPPDVNDLQRVFQAYRRLEKDLRVIGTHLPYGSGAPFLAAPRRKLDRINRETKVTLRRIDSK